MNLPAFIQKTPTVLKYLAGIGIPVGAIILAIFKGARTFVVTAFQWLWYRLRPSQNPHRVELKIYPDRTGLCQWQEGSERGEKIMLVHVKLFLTNVGPRPGVQILDVYMKKPRTQGHVYRSPFPPMGQPRFVRRQPGRARLAVPFEADFRVMSAACKSGKVFKANIVLVDQFGGKHFRKVEFAPVGGRGWAALEEYAASQIAAQRGK